MNVKWYYRQSEVPDSVYQHLVQDRNNENGEAVLCSFFYRAHTLTHIQKVNMLTCSVTQHSISLLHKRTHLPQLSRLFWGVVGGYKS